jgi:hypothetical protein
MAGNIRSWLVEHPIGRFALGGVGVWLVFMLINVVIRMITGNWCP